VAEVAEVAEVADTSVPEMLNLEVLVAATAVAGTRTTG
jgi:hypothetical protein